MQLSLGDKIQIFLSSATGPFGLLFGVGGLLFLAVFLPLTDFDSPRFSLSSVSTTEGRVTGIFETNSAEDDEPIRAISYHYGYEGHGLVGYSYSSTLNVKPSDKVVVEYIMTQPAYSRIKGTGNAPFPIWTAPFLLAFVAIGSKLVFEGLKRAQLVAAIAADALVTTAVCEKIVDTNRKSEDDKIYEARYTYHFNGRAFTHAIETTENELNKFSVGERLVLQRGAPQNALLASNLPAFIWKRIQQTQSHCAPRP